MKKKIVSIAVMLSVISLAHGAAFPSSSNDTSGNAAPQRVIPSLQQKAFQALVSHPGVFARQLDMINFDPTRQSQLFVESVKRALVSRLGWRVLGNPKFSLQQSIFSVGHFDGFSPDSSLVAVSVPLALNAGKMTYLINIATGLTIRQIAGELRGFSADGSRIVVEVQNAAGTGLDTYLIDTTTGATISRIAGAGDFRGFSADGSRIAVLGVGHVTHLINIITGATIRQIAGSFAGFSPDRSLIAVMAWNHAGAGLDTYLIDTTTGATISRIAGAGDLRRFSAGGSLIALEVRNPVGAGYETHLINIATGAVMRKIAGTLPALSPDGASVAVSVPNAVGAGRETHLINIATGTTLRQIAGYFKGFSPDGNSIAVKNDLQSKTHLINTTTGATIYQIDGDFKNFSPDGNFIVISHLNADRTAYETRIIDIITGAVIWQIPGDFVGFSPDGTMMMTTGLGNRLILTTIDFRPDLAKIVDLEQRKFLLNAAQAWLDKKAYPVDESNYSLYQKIIERIPYLNDPLLFDVQVTLQGIYAASRAELDEYAARVFDADDPQLKDLSLRAYDAWYDVQKAQDAQKDDNVIFRDFLETIKARHVWRVVRQHADALTNNYQADRAARVAQQTPQVPTSSSSPQASEQGPVVGSSQDGVRAPDAPVTMRLFD